MLPMWFTEWNMRFAIPHVRLCLSQPGLYLELKQYIKHYKKQTRGIDHIHLWIIMYKIVKFNFWIFPKPRTSVLNSKRVICVSKQHVTGEFFR